MHLRPLIKLTVSLLAWTIATAAASAEEKLDIDSMSTTHKRAFVGLSGGIGYAWVKQPTINSNAFAVAIAGLHAGMNVSEHWALGAELLTAEHAMTRNSAADPFMPTGFLSPQGACGKCADRPPPTGGWIAKTAATFTTIGPRIEYAPLGRDGLYFGLSTGVGLLLGVDTQVGFGGGARAGYRYRIDNILGIGIEGGVQAQHFKSGTTFFPYGSLVLRPYF
jgi:hypothetical protein